MKIKSSSEDCGGLPASSPCDAHNICICINPPCCLCTLPPLRYRMHPALPHCTCPSISTSTALCKTQQSAWRRLSRSCSLLVCCPSQRLRPFAVSTSWTLAKASWILTCSTIRKVNAWKDVCILSAFPYTREHFQTFLRHTNVRLLRDYSIFLSYVGLKRLAEQGPAGAPPTCCYLENSDQPICEGVILH